ncbi:hypothetical protein [Nocardioides zeae]|uniref:Uncharacterized protein n=1 Tax=Nocardioides zeae TaxID=1457234 RepID=A0A6P0HJ88_9ACTN|nr:hypothetical protein [Nocardioides zeae]NEN78671.1 hypothetical protein [Nocardioides zeae]
MSYAPSAHAATDTVSGSLWGGEGSNTWVFYTTQRYHSKSQPLTFWLKTAYDPCGGGNLFIRPLRSNGNWMASAHYWGLGSGTNNLNSTRHWGQAGTIAAGNFTLAASTNTYCGVPPPSKTTFSGGITY